MAWTSEPLHDILNREIGKIPWDQLKSTQPIRDRIVTLESVLASVNSDLSEKLRVVEPRVSVALNRQDALSDYIETSLVVIKNSRFGLQRPIRSIKNLIVFFILTRR